MIQKLIKSGVPFAVCNNILTASGVYDMHGNDYFVLFHKQDESKVMDAGVYVPKKNNQNSPQLSSVALIKKHTREITMTDDDVLEFKSNINKFKSVLKNEYARVYELNGNSFKDYYKKKLTKCPATA